MKRIAVGVVALLFAVGTYGTTSYGAPPRRPASSDSPHSLLMRSDLKRILKAPRGYHQPNDGGGQTGNGKAFCSHKVTLARPTHRNSVHLDVGVSRRGPYSGQGIQVFGSSAAAKRYARAIAGAVPCSERFRDGTTDEYSKRPKPHSYEIKESASGIHVTGIVDVVAVRNVVYTNVDARLGTSIKHHSHDARTRRVVATLRKL